MTYINTVDLQSQPFSTASRGVRDDDGHSDDRRRTLPAIRACRATLHGLLFLIQGTKSDWDAEINYNQALLWIKSLKVLRMRLSLALLIFYFLLPLPCLPQTPANNIPRDLANKAAAGDADAMIALGKEYWNGNNVPFDLEKACEWLDRAASKGALEAQMFLGMAYFSGTKVSQDRKIAARYLVPAAEQGNSLAQYFVGMMYRQGLGLEQSDAKAFQFLKRAVDSGSAPAAFDLALMYDDGIATPADKPRACELYAIASEHGHIPATNNLGQCYELGIGCNRNPAKAMELYTKAAEAGHRKAQGNLAIMYGGMGKWEESYFWMRVAESLGSQENRPAIERVKAKLTPEQVAAAEERIKEWQKAHKK